jgi:hypothetical protein
MKQSCHVHCRDSFISRVKGSDLEKKFWWIFSRIWIKKELK